MKLRLRKPKLPKIVIPQSIVVWVIGMLSIVLGLEFCYFNGILEHIYSSDVTKLSVVIAGILCWQSFMCGRQLWRYDKNKSSKSEALSDVEKGWLWSDVVLSLGMIGTVIPISRQLFTKSKYLLLSKNICVTIKSEPASTFFLRFFRSVAMFMASKCFSG